MGSKVLCGRPADLETLHADDSVDQLELAHALGRIEERTRLAQILADPAAADRPLAARTIALSTELPAPQAVELLQALPRETSRSPFSWWRP